MSVIQFFFVVLYLCCAFQLSDGQPKSVHYELSERRPRSNSPRLARSSLLDESTSVVAAIFDYPYSFSVNQLNNYMFVYSYNEINTTTAVRVSCSSSEADENFPVMFIVRQQEGILSWQIPLFIDYTHQFNNVNRTLCPVNQEERRNMTSQQKIYIDVSTMAASNKTFNLSAQLLQDFQLQHGSIQSVTVSPSQPQYYMYTFPHDVDTVLLRVTSPDRACAVVSVQSVRCPIFDLDFGDNMQFEGKHQTMISQATIYLQRSKYEPFAAFYVVVVMKPDSKDCLGSNVLQPEDGSTIRQKTISISITQTISSEQYIKATVPVLFIYIGFWLFMAISECCCCPKISQYVCLGKSRQDHHSTEDLTETENDTEQILQGSQPSSYGAVPATADHEILTVENPTYSSQNPQSSGDDQDHSEIVTQPDADKNMGIVRTETVLFLSNLSRKSFKKQSKTYMTYVWNLLTIALFYGLPVAQLVLTNQWLLLTTGDEDMCYYNFDCAHPLKQFSAFNSIISNMGYAVLGLTFITIILIRDRKHRRLLENSTELERHKGIPQHYGLLYAMGFALVMEGVMSACYHVCPNYTNIQFDTSFMYIIACLIMLKIYETRHPDVQAKANRSYFCMALVILIALVGMLYGNLVMWIIYALIHMLCSLITGAWMYNMGRIKVGCCGRQLFCVMDRTCCCEWWSFLFKCEEQSRCDKPCLQECCLCLQKWCPCLQKCCRCLQKCCHCLQRCCLNKFRHWKLILGILFNCGLAVYGVCMRPSDFATYLVFIIVGNLLLHFLFYIIMKICCGEGISYLAILCIITSAVMWGFAICFFVHSPTSWELSPAESRERNSACRLFDFYDNHDIWHFFSSFGMFFSLYVLLILDDSLSMTPRDKIRVF